MGIAALVLGILALVMALAGLVRGIGGTAPLAMVLALIGLIFGGGAWRGAKTRAEAASIPTASVLLSLLAIATVAVQVVSEWRANRRNGELAAQEEVIDRMGAIAMATVNYKEDNGETCPKTVAVLVGDHRVSAFSSSDPWGQPFLFTCPGKKHPDAADIVSTGPDKTLGTADDVEW